MVLVKPVTDVKSGDGGIVIHQGRVVDTDKGDLIVVITARDLASYDVVIGV